MATRRRFVGSGRLKEGGLLATHKQDFLVHTKGTDWRHTADQIDMNLPIALFNSATTVQQTFEEIAALLIITNDCFVSIGDGYARGDFNVGDPGIPDFETAFSMALALPNVQSGGTILIKPGTYTITTTVNVPPGINVMGDPTGTTLIGEMTEQPMFKLLRASDRFGVGPAEDMAVQKSQTRLWNLTLFDNLFGNVASGGPSMITTQMIQCQRGSNVLIENCTIIGKAVDNPQVFVTGRGIGYVDSSNSEPTTLKVKDCVFDAQRVSIEFNNPEGAPNTLKVENTRSRTFGDGGLINANERCFVLFALCNAQFLNNLHVGLNDTWEAESCFRISNTAVANDNVRVVITGNTGQIEGASVDFFNRNNFLIDSRTIKNAYTGVLLGNNWGFNYNSQFYYTVGDGSSSVGDITGTNAIDLAMERANSSIRETFVYVLPGTYVLTTQGSATDSVNLIGVSPGVSGTNKPTIELNLPGAVLDVLGRRTTHFGAGKLQNLNFFPNSAAATFQSVSCLSAAECFISNCNFFNVGLSVADMDGTIQNCLFAQGTNFPDSLSLDVIAIGNKVEIKNNAFLGRGYALSVTGAPFVGSNIEIENNVFDQYKTFTPEPPGARVSVALPVARPSYYININAFETVVFRDNFVKAFNTTATLDLPILGALLVAGTFDKYMRISGMNLHIEDNEIYGPNQIFTDGPAPLPTLYLEPKNSCYVVDSKVTGALPIQVSGSAYSLISTADPRVNGGILQISRNQLKGYPLSGANECGTVIDLDLPKATLVIGTDSISHVEISDNVIDQGMLGLWKTARHLNVIGADYDVVGTIQAYGENWFFNIIDNSIVSRFPDFPAGFTSAACVVIDNQITAADPAELRARSAPVFKGNNLSVNTSVTVGVTESFFMNLIRAERTRVEGNQYSFVNSTGVSSTGDYGFLRIESVSLGSVVAGNSFDVGTAIPAFGASGSVSLSGGGGVFNSNAFTSPFRSVTDPVDMVNPTTTDWHIAFDNAGLRYSIEMRYNQGVIADANSVIAIAVPTFEVSIGQSNTTGLTIDIPAGPSSGHEMGYTIDLSSILPKGAKIVSANTAFNGDLVDMVGTVYALLLVGRGNPDSFLLGFDSQTVPGTATLTIGSQASSLDYIIDDKYLKVFFDGVNTSGGAVSASFEPLTIWFQVG